MQLIRTHTRHVRVKELAVTKDYDVNIYHGDLTIAIYTEDYTYSVVLNGEETERLKKILTE